MDVTVHELPDRCVAVVDHDGPEETIEESRRPLYRHMIMEELVGGPSMVRFDTDGTFDLLVQTHVDFEGDAVCRVETLPGGKYAVADFEGPREELVIARQKFMDAVAAGGLAPAGRLLQIHLMDDVDGVLEQQFQLPVQ